LIIAHPPSVNLQYTRRLDNDDLLDNSFKIDVLFTDQAVVKKALLFFDAIADDFSG
jgi:hypothetical protein